MRSLACCLAAILLAIPAGASAAETPPVHFRHREIAFLLDNSESPRRHAPETMEGGVAAFDYDNDGDLDLYFANGAGIKTLKKTGENYWNRLYANDGQGIFTDVTAKTGVQGLGYDTGLAVADYDNDGDQDIFIGGVHRYTLYRNEGDGTFREVTRQAGLDGAMDKEFGPLWSVGGAWMDVNADGLLDLFVVNYLSWNAAAEPECKYEGAFEYCHPGLYDETPNSLYVNNGDGTFRNLSAEAGLREYPGKGMGSAVADFDGDGRPDVFVANDKIFNFLFRNTGGNKFEEVGFEAGVALPEHGNFISGMGVDARDMDNDGHPDIAFVALDNETFPLYRNLGDGTFEEVTSSAGMTMLSRSMAGYSPAIYDFDNDGWKDLFVSRGHVQSTGMAVRVLIDQHNTVFRNLGRMKMEAATETAGFDAVEPKRHRGSAHGDFNGDGKIDIAVSALRKPAEIWLNDGAAGNHWLLIDLEGTRSNRDGIGARLKVVTASGEQFNHLSTAVGYASSSAGPLHFGLGQDTVVKELEIRWPSGTVQTLKDVKPDQVLQVKEPHP